MAQSLSTTDWEKFNSYVSEVGGGGYTRWDTPWDVDIPPLPPLDSNDEFAVKHYILSLVRSAAQAGMDFASFRVFVEDDQPKVECAISVQLPDDYEVKGLKEWEIRQIASTEDFRKGYIEGLIG